MRMRTFVSLASLFVAGISATPAVAQQAATGPAALLRGYLVAGGGTSVGLPQTSPAFSAEIAERIRPDVLVYLAANYSDNVISDAARQDLADAGALLSDVTGVPWEFTGRDRARSVTLGVKYLVPTASGVRPYVGGGFGVLNLRRTIRERNRGVMTETFFNEFGAPDGAVDASQTNTNRPMGELAAGVGIAIRRTYVDIGYRYRRAFRTGDGLSLSQIGVALGLKF